MNRGRMAPDPNLIFLAKHARFLPRIGGNGGRLPIRLLESVPFRVPGNRNLCLTVAIK